MPPKKIFRFEKNQLNLFHFVSKTDGNNNPVDPKDILVATPLKSTESHKDDLVSDDQNSGTVITDKKCWDRWVKSYPWLYQEDGKMFCKYCKINGKNNSLTKGCTHFRTSTLYRHEVIDDHIQSVATPSLAENFQLAVSKAFSKEDEAMVKMIKTVVWLAKENLPLSKFESLVNFLNSVDVPGLEALECSEKVNYKSYYTANEILSAIGDHLDCIINQKLHQSPCVAVLADESTDIANKKRMTINAVVIDPETSCPNTIYLRNVEYEDGTGVGLASVIVDEFYRRNISFDKILGFGSDGASVMTGSDRGVKGILLRKQPHMIHIHCMAHRLALCTSQAAESVPNICEYQRFLTNLFYYFKASPSREQELHQVQAILNHPGCCQRS
ncbi:zinc finger protein 862-like [Ruditapes philippinarum]|uniref:zinc finger protein 862-like n=1 Tax=Ruditapes philippinarum TaxID=129788 RepID=UPI00295B5C14|nr:zinc finger protein 862-like [Ruditapes philippinarum]